MLSSLVWAHMKLQPYPSYPSEMFTLCISLCYSYVFILDFLFVLRSSLLCCYAPVDGQFFLHQQVWARQRWTSYRGRLACAEPMSDPKDEGWRSWCWSAWEWLKLSRSMMIQTGSVNADLWWFTFLMIGTVKNNGPLNSRFQMFHGIQFADTACHMNPLACMFVYVCLTI